MIVMYEGVINFFARSVHTTRGKLNSKHS